MNKQDERLRRLVAAQAQRLAAMRPRPKHSARKPARARPSLPTRAAILAQHQAQFRERNQQHLDRFMAMLTRGRIFAGFVR